MRLNPGSLIYLVIRVSQFSMGSGEAAPVACYTDYAGAAFAALAIFRRYYVHAVYVLNRFWTPSKSNCSAPRRKLVIACAKLDGYEKGHEEERESAMEKFSFLTQLQFLFGLR